MAQKTNQKIREYANQNHLSEWQVFELAYYRFYGDYDETTIDKAYNTWFNKGELGGPVPGWVVLFFAEFAHLEA